MATGDAQITASWNDVLNHGEYRVEYKKSADSTWTLETTVSYTTTQVVIKGLIHGVDYDVRVRSQTTDVNGTYASQTITAHFSRPSEIDAEYTTDTNVRLSFTRKDNNNSGRFEIYRSETAGTLGNKIREISDLSATAMTDEDVEPGKAYYYTVRRVTTI